MWSIRNVLRYVRVFSDFESIQNWRKLRNEAPAALSVPDKQAKANGPSIREGRQLVRLRPRATGGKPLYCRTGTRDADVFHEVFLEKVHLPPHDLEPVHSIIDLGSNIGLTVAYYANLYPEAKILGIELDGGNFDLCQKNIAPYGERCSVVRGAVWVEDGEVGYAGESEWAFHVVPNGGTLKAMVQAYSMESLMRSFGARVIDFIKMDIEGAERQLLADAGPWIGRVRCLKIEIHRPYTIEACIEQLQRYGLACEVWRDGVEYVIARNSKAAVGATVGI